MLSSLNRGSADGQPRFANDTVPFSFCMQDEAHEQGKEGNSALQMIAECNDPNTRNLGSPNGCYPQPVYLVLLRDAVGRQSPEAVASQTQVARGKSETGR
jgi:hypothetical protein